MDGEADEADRNLWEALRRHMATAGSPWLHWQLTDELNNDRGVLLFHVSRNHNAPEALELLAWIGEHGPGSYGLYYVHDDEDDGTHRRASGIDQSNVFRVIRLRHGEISELDDPFLGPVYPRLEW